MKAAAVMKIMILVVGRHMKIPAAVAKPIGVSLGLEYLDIELTERCNLDCVHCYIRRGLNDREAIKREMSFGFIRRLLKQAVALGCQGVRFTGGEPLIRPDFVKIYRCAFDLGLKVSVSTNATLITDQIADLFAEKPPESISISLYGWDEDSYRFTVFRKERYGQFLAGINRLRERNIAFHLKYPPTKFLVANAAKLAELARRLGVAEELPFAWELTLHARRNALANRRILTCRMDPVQAAIQRLKEPGVAERTRQAIGENKKPKPTRMFACRAAKKRLTIDAYGRLQICLEVRHPETTYDLTQGRIADALAGHIPQYRQMRFTNPGFLNHCGRCRLWPACPVCPACSWMENGNLDTPPEYLCAVIHAEAVILGLLGEGEKGWEKPCRNANFAIAQRQ